MNTNILKAAEARVEHAAQSVSSFTPFESLYHAAKAIGAGQYRDALLGADRDALVAALEACEKMITAREAASVAIETARDAIIPVGDVEIDDLPLVSPAPDGTWVAAWIYVPNT